LLITATHMQARTPAAGGAGAGGGSSALKPTATPEVAGELMQRLQRMRAKDEPATGGQDA
jgi:hypothetical protein